MSDIITIFDTAQSRCDWQMAGAQLASGDDLSTTILLSLFTDRLANPDDTIPDGTADPRGWWGDQGEEVIIGSRLWLLDRSKLTEVVAAQARDYAAEALKWMQDDGVVTEIDITTQIILPNILGLQVVVTKPDGKQQPFNFSWAWAGAN